MWSSSSVVNPPAKTCIQLLNSLACFHGYWHLAVNLFKCGQSSCKDRPHPASKFLCVASWLLASGCKSDESENRGVGYNFKLKSAIKINPARFVSISVREFHFQFNFKTAVSKIRFQTSPSRLGKLYTQEEFS